MSQDIRAPYYGELGRMSFSPGWARPEPAMWPTPKPKFRPAVWRYAAAREALDQAGEFASPHRGGIAAGGRGRARHLHRGRRHARRHGARRRGADAVVVLARPRE